MVLDGVDFLPGMFLMLETFLVVEPVLGVRLGGHCYWHLVSRGQGYYKISYNTQDKPYNKELSCLEYQ